MSEAIFVEGLTKTYAGKAVVDHLDLSVKSGTVFGLIDIPTEDEIKSLMAKIKATPQEYRLTA